MHEGLGVIRKSLLVAAEDRASVEKATSEKLSALADTIKSAVLYGGSDMNHKLAEALASKVDELAAIFGANSAEKHDLLENIVSNFMREVVEQAS